MQTSLRLPDDIADTIAERVKPSRGSIPAYAQELAILFAQLSPSEEAEFRVAIADKIRRRVGKALPVFAEAQR